MTTTQPWRPPKLLAAPHVAVITPRQADVLCGIAFGHGNAQIGAVLGITEDTVKSTVKHLMLAMGARNRAHAAALACSGQLTIAVRVRNRRTA